MSESAAISAWPDIEALYERIEAATLKKLASGAAPESIGSSVTP